MFPTFISILDIQSWWEVPSIAHFCSLFRTAFNLLDFDIEDLEEALLTDGTEESSWLQELIVRLLSGCLPSNEISTFNYQMFLRRLFRQKCQEHDRYNPFNTDIDFQLLPLRTKVDILHSLCDFRLDADDVLDQLKNLEADSLRVEPLGYDGNDSAYWYFYGTRLYREDFRTKNNKKKSVWQVICFTEDDWFQLTRKFKKSTCKVERQLYQTLNENFLPELPRLFKEKESLARKRLLENQPRRTSSRLRKLDSESTEKEEMVKNSLKEEILLREKQIIFDQEQRKNRRQKAYERRLKLKEQSEEDSLSEVSVDQHEMAGTKSKRSKERQRRNSYNSSSSKEYESSKSSKRSKKNVTPPTESSSKSSSSSKPTTVGRQTNNSLSAATGQILIQPVTNPTKKKLKTSQIFRQTDEDLQTGMHKILDFVKNHEDAWPFADPVEEEYAPNYYTVIRKPMDLQRMEERLDSGYYKTFAKFRSDFQLIVDNCRLYNGAENEYTEMVDNLEKVFERGTEKYLDQISSSDDEIAVEFLNADLVDIKAKSEDPSPYKRKPMLAAQTDKKRERSNSEDSLSDKSNSFEKVAKSKVEKVTKKQSKGKREKEVKKDKSEKESRKEKSEKESRKEKSGKEFKRNKSESMKDKSEIKKEKDVKKTKEKKNKSKKATKKEKRKTVAKSRHVSRSPSRSVRSDMSSPPPSWPPSSPDSRFDFIPKKRQETSDSDESLSQGKYKKSGLFDDFATAVSKEFNVHVDKKIKIDYISPPLSPKPKDKHNKLRETIEKLKAKSELKLKDEFDFEVDHPKENKDKNKITEKEEKFRAKIKEKPAKLKKEPLEPELDCNSTMDSERSENRKPKKVPLQNNAAPPPAVKNPSNLEALSIATEQTLKDINKWLDDTPKFSEFSSASNSPSYTGLDEFDVLSGAKIDQIPGKKVERPGGGGGAIKKEGSKDGKKRPFRDPAKFFKRREVQRTIERLQPGKSKGNLIANVQNTNKVEEIFPLGPLSKIKDTKNSLIVKTDTNAPKLSLGSVLDSFGKHKFVDDQKKEEQVQLQVLKEENQQTLLKETVSRDNKSVEEVKEVVEKKEDKVEKETNAVEDAGIGGATPNLSAWFKAFGAPKMPAPQKKTDIKPDGKENEKTDEVANKNTESRKVALPTASPNTDSPLQHGQPTPRQRKISTGSSMSERSSFSQDMDSPRVGFDERGAYPAPYPSPMHRSPSGASPVMASPRPDISPKAAAYPTINGQIRVGFYQDTVSNKSSPDKSCSPRENPQSPYPHYSEHVYTPTTTESSFYSYAANSPYYSHAPNYSSTNPTPPYNTEASNSSYYDTSKSLTDQYQAKSAQKYTANSPLSDSSSPARRQPRHSPGENTPTSPGTGGMNSPHSPSVYSQHSPIVLPQHSPNVSAQQSPSVHSQASPNVQAQLSPAVQAEHSPKPSPDVPSESQDGDLLSANEESKLQQGASFPVKKRTYSDDLPQISIQRYEIDSRLSQRERISQSNQVIELDASPEPSPPCSEKRDSDCLTIQSVSDLKSAPMKEASCVETPGTKQQTDFAAATAATSSTFSAAFGADSNFPLNIPAAGSLTASQATKLDMSKYTNMGYTGPEVNLTRSLSLQQYNKPELSSTRTTVSQKYTAQQSLTAAASQSGDMAMRYGNPNSALQQMGYKSMEITNPQQAHSNFGTARTSENVTGRLSQAQDIPSGYKPEVTIPRPSYNNPAIPNHIVDRFSNEERILAGLQSTTSYYTDKGLGTSHMFNKAISTSASALPMFSQANIAAMQTFSQNVQGTTSSMYNRQMSELQNPGLMQAEEKTSQPAPEKKAKKRKSKASASAAPTESQLANAANQGFQSYAGLKGNSTIEPGAISLKTSSVVPGSAFNFGPTPAGLGIGTSLYGDKDAFPNFLEEFRSAPNYYMAAAAAVHHRSTPEAADKQTGRAAHQSSNAQAAASYPFLGAPQARSTYPIGGPFIPNAQAQLMDSSSPLYQQYIQAGLLNQGLLGPPGAYPPGYHAALSMRQPYDSMTRPSWL